LQIQTAHHGESKVLRLLGANYSMTVFEERLQAAGDEFTSEGHVVESVKQAAPSDNAIEKRKQKGKVNEH